MPSPDLKDFRVLQRPDDVARYLDEVIKHADQHKNELGFLATTVFKEQALKGRLWVLIDGESQYSGHLLFGGPRTALKITQLFVRNDLRRRGCASLIVTELCNVAEANGYQYVQARVAAELPANAFWERHGFVTQHQVDGGSSSGRPRTINVRVYYVPGSSLFESPARHAEASSNVPVVARSQRLSYVIDTNLVIDVARQRSGHESIEPLLNLALAHELQIRVTPEMIPELERGTSFNEADPAVRVARLFPPLPRIPDAEIGPTMRDLLPLVFPSKANLDRLNASERSDLIHLAYCVAHVQSGFITRDGPVLKAAQVLYERFGIDIVSNYDLVPIAEVRGPTAFQSQEWGQLDHQCSEDPPLLSDMQLDSPYLYRRLSKAGTRTDRYGLSSQSLFQTMTLGGQPVSRAVVDWHVETSTWMLTFESSCTDRVTREAIDLLLQNVMRRSVSKVPTRVILTFPVGNVAATEYAAALGCVRMATCDDAESVSFGKLMFKGIVGEEQWPSIRVAFDRGFKWILAEKMPTFQELLHTGVRVTDEGGSRHRYMKSDAFERFIAPGVLISKDRPSAIVPIRSEYAARLFPELSRIDDMLPQMYAGVFCERVYFSSALGKSPVRENAIVFFYRSGTGIGAQHLFAMARVTGVYRTTSAEARLRFLSRGVLDLPKNDEAITAIVFDNIHALKEEIPLHWLKNQEIVSGANLVTSQQIAGKQAIAIVRRAGNG